MDGSSTGWTKAVSVRGVGLVSKGLRVEVRALLTWAPLSSLTLTLTHSPSLALPSFGAQGGTVCPLEPWGRWTLSCFSPGLDAPCGWALPSGCPPAWLTSTQAPGLALSPPAGGSLDLPAPSLALSRSRTGQAEDGSGDGPHRQAPGRGCLQLHPLTGLSHQGLGQPWSGGPRTDCPGSSAGTSPMACRWEAMPCSAGQLLGGDCTIHSLLPTCHPGSDVPNIWKAQPPNSTCP